VNESRDAAEQAGARAARNTAARAAGEIAGKVASLVLFAVLARKVGESGLGSFVFAFAFLQIAIVPVDLGFDRYLLRRIAADRAAAASLLWNVLTLKLVLALPVAALAFPFLFLMGSPAQSRETVYVLAGGILIDSLARTVFSVFTAFERSEFVAISLVVQRVLAAALGLIALSAGHGVVTVAAAYSAGAIAGLLLGSVLLRRLLGPLRPSIRRDSWPDLRRRSLPFAVQDVFTVILFKFDAVLLAALATAAAVGRYGAAYRLLEGTFFLTVAMSGAFAPMYTYLGADTSPTIRSVFQRSVKLSLVVLTPVAVAFAVLALPLTRLIFGHKLDAAATPLRILAPSVVLLGVITLAASLFVSRRDPRAMVKVTGWMALVNIALNVALIPPLEDTGAAIAMTFTEALYCIVSMRLAIQTAGGVDWPAMVASPLAGGVVAAGVMAALSSSLALALAAGTAAYIVVFVVVERTTAPTDLQFAATMLRRVLRLRPAA
jgi:O-antigen/teichoic acid export membrane protein